MKLKSSRLQLVHVIAILSIMLSLLYGFVLAPTVAAQGPVSGSHPTESHLVKAHAFTGDLRNLPQVKPTKQERPELAEPEANPIQLPGSPAPVANPAAPSGPSAPAASAPAPIITFDGLDFANWGAGHPPDPNGDVGPTYYIQTINTSIGIYDKATGSRVAAFTFDTLMSQGSFGNLCDTANSGDPVVLYDSFEDRWIITDFAFTVDGSGNVINPPGSFQCFAVSRSEDPVAGGWNFYSINTTGGLGDYPKFGIWPDGLYMSANMFGYPSGAPFQNARVYAFNKAQMYAGISNPQVVSFDAPPAEFTLLPANARLQTGTPPPGSPNYFAVVWQFLNVVSVYKFHVDWNSISTSTFTGPFMSLTSTNWSQFTGAGGLVPTPANNIDTLYPRLMVQNQYTNIGGVESLWDSHTVGATGASSAQAAVRYYQVKVTGGTVEANATQAFTWSPDAILHRFMPSVAVDRAGNMAIGYSTSNATTNPGLKYAGRLAGDPVNTILQTEQTLYQGTASQSGNCGVGACTRWGDYSAMTLDPDGCTFWYTNEYYTATNSLNFLTRIGSFQLPACTVVGSGGAISGTVIDAGNSSPLSGVTVTLGSRITTTNGSGVYQFLNIPAGVYPSIGASYPGYSSSSTGPITVTDSLTTTQNFALSTAAASGCFVDTTQADFQTGVFTNCDLTGSPGNVTLLNAANIDQQNTSVTINGFSFTNLTWAGQTFRAGVSGQLTRADLDLFCSGCTGTTPNLTVSIRATAGSPAVPTGADLATATIPGFSSSSGGYFTANFATPTTIVSGTTYAVILRAVSAPSAGIYAYVCSCTPNTNPYANGQRVTSANSGGTWVADVTVGGRDLGFKVYVNSGYSPTGTLVSGVKDANPSGTFAPRWTTLAWNATTPASTSVEFQAAASNSTFGPFTFVGPDGTASTFFTTTGASLSQFDGLRYLKYTAYLTSTDSANTPTLADVTVCFSNTSKSTAIAIASSQNPSLSGQGVTFTVSVAGAGGTPTGQIQFKDNGSNLGAAQTLSGGSALIFTSALPVGSHTITATYTGDTFFNANSGALAPDQVVTSTATWNGSTSAAWNTPGNWNTNAVPGSIHAANIPAAGVTNEPSTSSVVTITSLTIGAGRTLSLGGDLNISGDWANNGTLTPNSNTVTFDGSNNTQTLSGATTFDNLTINHTGTGGVTASGSTLSVSNLLNIVAGTFTSSSTYKDVQIGSGATLASDGGTINVGGNWTNNGTFTAGSGTVIFNGTLEQTISGSNPTAYNNMTVMSNARVAIPDTNPPTIAGSLTVQSGGALKQTRSVNNASVPFLQISTDKYRGVDLTTINNLGSTTVVITTTSSNSCTTTLGGSPAYANRCYSITPTTNVTATVRLWALASELNGILESNLAPYHYNGSTWTPLTNVSTGNDGGSYSFAQGDTTGFSPFLLGNSANAPTAITLVDFSQASTSNSIVLLIAALIVLALLIVGLRLRRKVRV